MGFNLPREEVQMGTKIRWVKFSFFLEQNLDHCVALLLTCCFTCKILEMLLRFGFVIKELEFYTLTTVPGGKIDVKTKCMTS